MTDLILAGGDIVTLDPRRPAASAVAITGGRITAIGDHHDIRQWRGNRTEVIDLDESTFEPPPDTLAGPARDLVIGTFKLQDRLMLALDPNHAVDTYRGATDK